MFSSLQPPRQLETLDDLLTQGVCTHLLNCPLDMIIETTLRDTMPQLSAAQFLSVRLLAEEAWTADNNRANRELTPRSIMRATLALNGAYALFVDDLYRGACDYASNYDKLDTFDVSQQLFRSWQTHFPSLGPGDEYGLVDEFASMVGLQSWYEWKPDPVGSKPGEGQFASSGTFWFAE